MRTAGSINKWKRYRLVVVNAEVERSPSEQERMNAPIFLLKRDSALRSLAIVETCRRLSLPVRDYLGSVLPGLADFPINRVAELTPTAWAVRN